MLQITPQHASPAGAVAAAHTLYIDVETRSPLHLRDVGAFQYARNPQTQIICLSFACDRETPQTWVPATSLIRQEFNKPACDLRGTAVAHIANFELAIMRTF